MPRKVLPDALTRREWIEEPARQERDRRVAEAYLAQGRRAESLAFLERAESRESLADLVRQAIEEGDVFLLRESCRALGHEPDREQWSRLAAAAEQAGKDAYAAEARRLAERKEG